MFVVIALSIAPLTISLDAFSGIGTKALVRNFVRGYGTKSIMISFSPTFLEPGKRVHAVTLLSTLAARAAPPRLSFAD